MHSEPRGLCGEVTQTLSQVRVLHPRKIPIAKKLAPWTWLPGLESQAGTLSQRCRRIARSVSLGYAALDQQSPQGAEAWAALVVTMP